MKNKRLLTPSEAAAELGISIRTLYRWEEADKLHTVRTIGNQRRIPIEEISRLRRLGRRQSGVERCALYARVLSVRQEQDGNLARRMERPSKRLMHEAMRWWHSLLSKRPLSTRSARV